MPFVGDTEYGTKFFEHVSYITLIPNVVATIPCDKYLVRDNLLHSKI